MSILIPSAWRYTTTPQQISPTTSPILLAKEPLKITASENVERFKFTANILNNGASKATTSINIINSVVVGEIVKITTPLTTITLTASATPSFGEFYTPASGTFANKSLTARNIAQELVNSLSFSNLYSIYCEDTTIYIAAKDFGGIYTMTLTTLPLATFVSYNIAGGYKYIYNNLLDYSASIDIFSSLGQFRYSNSLDRSEFENVFTFDVPFKEDNFNIDVHNTIKNYVDVELPEKKLNSGFNLKLMDDVAVANKRQPILRPYYLMYSDNFRYVVNGSKKKVLQGCSSIRWVQNSAQNLLNPYDFSKYVWNAVSSNPFQWLTDSGEYIPVDYDSQQFLQVIYEESKASGSYRVEIECFFYDGTSYHFSWVEKNIGGLSNNVSFDVSPNVWDLPNIEAINGKQIDYYKVYLTWRPTLTAPYRVSQGKTYRMRRICVDNKVSLIWFNKFGGWDSLDFIGNLTKSRERSFTEIKRQLPFEANNISTISNEVNLVNSIKSRDILTINSGILESNLYEWLKDISLSTSIFVWDNDLNKYISIVLENSDYNFNSDNTEFSLKISYRMLDNNTISR